MKTKHQILAAVYFFLFSVVMPAQGNYGVQYRQCDQCSNSGLDANSSSQVFTYGNKEGYLEELVADDYGPRQNGFDTYDWHGGIDYNSGAGNNDMGDLILAINQGTITGSLGSGYKRLVVQAGGPNFGYGHLFTSDGGNGTLPIRSGGCWLKLDTENRRCIVMVVDGDTAAIGTVSGLVSFNGKLFSVSDTVAAGSPIGPTGYSGLSGGAHLHLFSNPDNSVSTADNVTKDPLQYVSYEAPEYEVKLLRDSIGNIVNWSEFLYPGTVASHMVVRPMMRGEDSTANRYSSINDVNRVEVLMKKKYQSADFFALLKGGLHESDIQIAGRIGEVISPHYMYQDGVNPSIGSLERQGIRPFAYATYNARPYDDFYFTDFYTRIHRDDPMDGGTPKIAYCPEQARYNDGEYDLEARVTTVREAEHKAEASFILDNYMPYIRAVTLTARQIGCFPHHAAPLH